MDMPAALNTDPSTSQNVHNYPTRPFSNTTPTPVQPATTRFDSAPLSYSPLYSSRLVPRSQLAGRTTRPYPGLVAVSSLASVPIRMSSGVRSPPPPTTLSHQSYSYIDSDLSQWPQSISRQSSAASNGTENSWAHITPASRSPSYETAEYPHSFSEVATTTYNSFITEEFNNYSIVPPFSPSLALPQVNNWSNPSLHNTFFFPTSSNVPSIQLTGPSPSRIPIMTENVGAAPISLPPFDLCDSSKLLYDPSQHNNGYLQPPTFTSELPTPSTSNTESPADGDFGFFNDPSFLPAATALTDSCAHTEFHDAQPNLWQSCLSQPPLRFDNMTPELWAAKSPATGPEAAASSSTLSAPAQQTDGTQYPNALPAPPFLVPSQTQAPASPAEVLCNRVNASSNKRRKVNDTRSASSTPASTALPPFMGSSSASMSSPASSQHALRTDPNTQAHALQAFANAHDHHTYQNYNTYSLSSTGRPIASSSRLSGHSTAQNTYPDYSTCAGGPMASTSQLSTPQDVDQISRPQGKKRKRAPACQPAGPQRRMGGADSASHPQSEHDSSSAAGGPAASSSRSPAPSDTRRSRKRGAAPMESIHFAAIEGWFDCEYRGADHSRCGARVVNAHAEAHISDVHKLPGKGAKGPKMRCLWGDCTVEYEQNSIRRHVVEQHTELMYMCKFPRCELTLKRSSDVTQHYRRDHR